MESILTCDIVRTVLIITTPLILVLIALRIIFLRKEVKKRTRGLQHEIKNHKKTLTKLRQNQAKIAESESQLRLLLNSTAEGINAVDANGNCTLINKAALGILGFHSAEEALGKNMHDLIHHTKPDGTNCTIDNCLMSKTFKEGKGMHNNDDVLWRRDGSGFPAEYFSHPIHQKDNVTGAVVTFWDITERKKAKNELEIIVAERTLEQCV